MECSTRNEGYNPQVDVPCNGCKGPFQSLWPRGLCSQATLAEIKEKVKSCETCNDFLNKQQKEPLMTHNIPRIPRGQDLFTLYNEDYLVTADFFELDPLTNTESSTRVERETQ